MSGTAIAAGSRWVAVRGPHKGNELTVLSVSATGIKIRNAGGGANWGNQKVDQGKEHLIKRDAFLAHYVPKGSLVADEIPANGAWRKPSAAPVPKTEPTVEPTVEEPLPAAPAPVVGVIEPHGAPLNIEVILVTPLQAAAWLKRGGKNRRLVERRVAALAAAIRRGEWQLTGEAIKLDADSTVRDGQHRLAAIVRAGVPVQSLVVHGVAEAAFDVMDSGRSRGIADIVGLHGYPSATGLSAAIRNLMQIDRFGTINPGSRESQTVVTAASTLNYLREHPETLHGYRIGDTVRHAGLQGGVGAWGALFTLFYRISPEQAEEFGGYLATGAAMQAGHPALMLRNRAITHGATYSRTAGGREELAAMAIKAWNAYREGKVIQQLKYSPNGSKPESFPVPR